VNYTSQIVDSFRNSSIERILIIDDAYDPPDLDGLSSGDLLDILSANDVRSHVSEGSLAEKVREAAIEALNNNDFEDGAVSTAVAALYRVFLAERAASVDPGGIFAATKGSALGELEPLLELLQHCQDDSQILTVGKNDALDTSRGLKPDLIFMDFILSPPEQTTTSVADEPWASGGTQSTELLRSILSTLRDDAPAVVLMSSQDVARYKDIYFSRLDDRVMGLRFGFFDKNWVRRYGEVLTASGDAADVLMDTSGSFEFGRALEMALKTWKDGAEGALRRLCLELREFDVKDFAYLLKFRLYEEGEPFADYLEWFVGESLRAIVDEEVEWGIDEFVQLNDKTLTSAIEGAHPSPSERLARFFHRMRFNARTTRSRERFSLGDVFVSADHTSVRMVVSPDCDLVSRNGKRGASRILTIGGSIRGLEEDQAWAGDLIYDAGAKAIKWDLKDLMTHEFDELSSLQVGGDSYVYFSSMRSMSAQAIQNRMLADLSRVGVAVPPTVGVGAPVKVYLKKKMGNGGEVEEVEELHEAHVQVFMPRGGNDRRMRVLFSTRFYRELLARLEGLGEDDLLRGDRNHWRNWIDQTERVRAAMLRDGVELPGKGPFGVATLIGEREEGSWLEIVVDLSAEARMNVQEMDPLAF